jgi:hypothetical protein
MRSSSLKNSRNAGQLELPVDPSSPAGADAERRAAAIVASLPKLSGEEVFAAFEELDQLPTDVVKKALASETGPAPELDRLDDAIRRAHGLPPRPLRLRTITRVRDADIFDVGDAAEEQLRIAGKAWDGNDLAAEERLDGEQEGSFAGTLEYRVLADADGPRFDVLTYAEDAGSIFRAGTADLVGAIAYGVVEMKDKRARVAIQDALALPFVEEEPAASLSESDVASAAAVLEEAETLAMPARAPKKKSAAAAKKKAVTKKVATKKPASEKTAVKVTAAKKKAAAAPAKAPAKKAPAKKAPASKKAPAKKAPAKKAPAKKTVVPAGKASKKRATRR